MGGSIELVCQETSLLVWSEGEASSGEEGEPAASRDNWSSLARLQKIFEGFILIFIFAPLENQKGFIFIFFFIFARLEKEKSFYLNLYLYLGTPGKEKRFNLYLYLGAAGKAERFYLYLYLCAPGKREEFLS